MNVLVCLALLFSDLPGLLALETGKSDLGNPASVFCVENGGQPVIETDENGQRGYCFLPDGRRVDEWDYFRQNWDKAPSAE